MKNRIWMKIEIWRIYDIETFLGQSYEMNFADVILPAIRTILLLSLVRTFHNSAPITLTFRRGHFIKNQSTRLRFRFVICFVRYSAGWLRDKKLQRTFLAHEHSLQFHLGDQGQRICTTGIEKYNGRILRKEIINISKKGGLYEMHWNG